VGGDTFRLLKLWGWGGGGGGGGGGGHDWGGFSRGRGRFIIEYLGNFGWLGVRYAGLRFFGGVA